MSGEVRVARSPDEKRQIARKLRMRWNISNLFPNLARGAASLWTSARFWRALTSVVDNHSRRFMSSEFQGDQACYSQNPAMDRAGGTPSG